MFRWKELLVPMEVEESLRLLILFSERSLPRISHWQYLTRLLLPGSVSVVSMVPFASLKEFHLNEGLGPRRAHHRQFEGQVGETRTLSKAKMLVLSILGKPYSLIMLIMHLSWPLTEGMLADYISHRLMFSTSSEWGQVSPAQMICPGQ